MPPVKLAPLERPPSQKGYSQATESPFSPRSFTITHKPKENIDVSDALDLQNPMAAGRRSLPSNGPIVPAGIKQDAEIEASLPCSPVLSGSDSISKAYKINRNYSEKEPRRIGSINGGDDHSGDHRGSHLSLHSSVKTSDRQVGTKNSSYSVISNTAGFRNPYRFANTFQQRFRTKTSETGTASEIVGSPRAQRAGNELVPQPQGNLPWAQLSDGRLATDIVTSDSRNEIILGIIEQEIRITNFWEYPAFRMDPKGVMPQHDFHLNGTDNQIKSFLTLFDKTYPVIVPYLEREAVAMTILRAYPSIMARPLRVNLPALSPENIALFLLHSARMGDLPSLKLISKSPFLQTDTTDDEGRTALIFSAIGGHAACVRFLLSKGAYIDHQDKSGRTALHWAAYYGHLTTVKELWDHRPDYELEDFLGKSVIHCATYPESTDVLEFLIRMGDNTHRRRNTILREFRKLTITSGDMGLVSPEEDVNMSIATDGEQMTPLMWAAYYGHDKHIEMLASNNPSSALSQDIEGKTALHWTVSNRHGRCAELLLAKFPTLISLGDKSGRLPLHLAAACGNPTLVELILRAPGSNANAVDKMRRTPLHWAASKGHVSCINILCKNGAAIDAIDEHGASALHYAILYGRTDCVHVLLRKGSPINITDSLGRVPVMWACIQGHGQSLKMLVKANAKLTYKDKAGLTALHLAATSGSMTCCTCLVRSGADLHAKDRGGQTPIFKATIMGWDSIVIFLLNEGARVDELDLPGRTLCHYAAKLGYTAILQILISHGAPLFFKSHEGRTPLHDAAIGGFPDSIALLVKSGMDLNDQDESGKTALHYAAMNGWDQACSILLENGANPNQFDSPGDISKAKTPMDWAIANMNCPTTPQILALLKRFGGLTASELFCLSAERIQRSWRKHKILESENEAQSSP